MNRQEVIDFETFKSIFYEERDRVNNGKGVSAAYALRAFYDRIAPLREFPEEAIRKYIRDELIGHGQTKPWWVDETISIFKRLWEGTADQNRKKGGCPKCGGRGNNAPCDSMTYFRICPDCSGTGERRKGKRRKVASPDEK